MAEDVKYRRVSLARARALTGPHASKGGQKVADVAFFLPTAHDDGPVLYHDGSGTGAVKPDFKRMHEQGVTHLYICTQELNRCERELEDKLTDVLSDPSTPPSDKAAIVQSVGVSVARDLTSAPSGRLELDRATTVVDGVIACVLTDPMVAAHMLDMAGHERSTASHMFVVATLAVILGAEVFGEDEETLRELGLAGMLHDMGKLAISQDVLNKPTPLTPAEWQIIQQHPIESVRMIGDDPHATPEVRQIILQHHERVDGRGYPVGLTDEDMPPTSKILSIVDTFHAMIGRRSYRAALTPAEANRLICSQGGRQLDADLLACWNDTFDRYWSKRDLGVGGGDPLAGADEITVRHEHRSKPQLPKAPRTRPRRFECGGHVTVRCVYSGRLKDATPAPDEFVAAVHDLSRGGLCLYTAHPMYRGEVVNVHVSAGGEKSWLRGTVAWSRRQTCDVFKTGVRFIVRIGEDQVHENVPVKGMHDPDVIPIDPDKENGANRPTRLRGGAGRPNRASALDSLSAIATLPRIDAVAQRTVITLSMSGDPQVRLKAVDVLMRLHTRAAGDALVAMLKDVNTEIRGQALAAIGALELQHASGEVRLLLRDENATIALKAAGALGKLGDKSGLGLVMRQLERDSQHTRLAARAFGEITGHRFTANAEGIRAARRYLAAKKPVLVAG